MSYVKIRPRRGTAEEWTTANPVLAEGEIGYEVPDSGVGTGVSRLKIGDGASAWSDLPYADPIDTIEELRENINTLNSNLNETKLRVGYLVYDGVDGEGLRVNLPVDFIFNGFSYAVSNIQIPEGYIIDNDFPTIQATVNGCSVDGAPGMLRVERYHDSAIIVFLNDNYNGTLLLAIGVRLKRV